MCHVKIAEARLFLASLAVNPFCCLLNQSGLYGPCTGMFIDRRK
jgi:hypothetical protein